MKRTIFLPLLLLLLWLAPHAAALEIRPYDGGEFARARAEGRVVALQFHSGWCPICIMQERGVKALSEEKSLNQVTVFRADFFKEEALRKEFKVDSFSTLVVFRGGEERARSTADFQPDKLRQLFAKAL